MSTPTHRAHASGARTESRHRRDDTGASAVEFAMILPLLLLVVFGVINFGFLLAQNATLASAVREGARYGSVNSYGGTHTCANVVSARSRRRQHRRDVRQQGQGGGLAGRQRRCCRGRSRLPGVGRRRHHGGQKDEAPCIGSVPGTSDRLRVEATYVSPLFLAAPGVASSWTLDGSGTYQCEYSS